MAALPAGILRPQFRVPAYLPFTVTVQQPASALSDQGILHRVDFLRIRLSVDVAVAVAFAFTAIFIV